MRKTILGPALAALALTIAGGALAAPSFPTIKHDDEKKNPQDTVVGLTKDEAKDAKKNADVAKHKAKTAVHKAKVAEHKADDAAKAAQKAARP
jgi:hypothetical protein